MCAAKSTTKRSRMNNKLGSFEGRQIESGALKLSGSGGVA